MAQRNQRLDQTALALHQFLKEKNLSHMFLGGYQVHVWTSGIRATEDIDVVIKNQMFGGFTKVYQAFNESSDYEILHYAEADKDDKDATDPFDIIRLRYSPLDVPVDVIIKKLPSNEFHFPSSLLPANLPFYTPTDFMIAKIRCLTQRTKDQDIADISYMWSNHRGSLDLGRIKKKIREEDWALINQVYTRSFPLIVDLQRAL